MGKPEPVFDTSDAEDEAADAEGLADLDAGRIVPDAEMRAWLATWGRQKDRPE